MAIIGKIRSKGGLLIAIFVGSALLAFILGDLLGPGGSLLNTRQFDIGEIAGEPIPAQYFDKKVQDAIDNYKQQSNLPSADQSTIDMLREQAWNQEVNEIILGIEYTKVGVAVHADEVFDLITGPSPHRLIVQAFSNPETGQFNPQDVINFLKNMDKDESGKSRQQWLPFEQSIQRDQKVSKYLNLLKNGLLISTIETNRDYVAKNKSAKIKYAVQRFSAIPDSIIQITENDINNYYNEHKKEYEQESSRSIKYVSFNVNPSSDDSIAVSDWITRIKDEFEQVSGLEENRDYVNMNADTRFEDNFISKGSLANDADSFLFSTDAKTVFGPYLENGTYKLVKQIDIQYRPDSVKARHILAKSPENGDSSHVAKSDSIYALLKQGADFEALAKKESDDPGSAVKGGDLGWFTEGTMVKPFNDSCFAGKPGDVIKVYSQFGAHIIEILETTEPKKKIKTALIDRSILPSSKTFASYYANANRFAGNNTTLEQFDEATDEYGLVPRIKEDLKITDKTIVGLDSPREVIRWAFKQEKGTISGPFELGNKFVVCALTSIKEEGIASLEQIRTEMEIGAKNEKKASYIINKIEENDDNNIEDLVHNLLANNPIFDLKVETSVNVLFSSFSIPGVGREPELIGTVFGSSQGQLSKPLKGNAGIFVFVVDELTDAPALQDNIQSKTALQTNIKNRVDYEVLNALKSNTDIKDNRHLFY